MSEIFYFPYIQKKIVLGLQQLVREHKSLKEKESLFNSKVQKINNFFDNGLVKIMKSIEQISQM